MSGDHDLALIEKKLDTIIRILALSVTADCASLKDKAVLLSRVGLTPKDIASLCDTTPNTVSVALSGARRKRARK